MLGSREEYFTEMMRIHFIDNMAIPKQNKTYPRDPEICNVGRLLLTHHYYVYDWSDLCSGEKRRFLKKIHQ